MQLGFQWAILFCQGFSKSHTLNLDNNNGTRMPYYPRTLTHW